MNKYFFTDQVTEKFKSVEYLPDWLRNYPEFKDQIKVLRETLGMTQEQLAEKIGKSLNGIQKIEGGDVLPKISTLKMIADALNTELQISLVPRQNILEFLDNLAEKKAKELIKMSETSSALELQSPSDEESRKQLKNLKNEILQKRRYMLWARKERKK